MTTRTPSDRFPNQHPKSLRQKQDDARFLGYLLSLPFRIAWRLKFTLLWLAFAFLPVTYFGILDGKATGYEWFAFYCSTAAILVIGLALNLAPWLHDSGRAQWMPAWLAKIGEYAMIGGDLRSLRGSHRTDRVNRWLRTIGAVSASDLTKYRGQLREIRGVGMDITVQSPANTHPEAFADLVRKSRHFLGFAYAATSPQPDGTYAVKYRYDDPAAALAAGRALTLPTAEPFQVGRRATGENLALNIPGDAWHTAIQGQTRSGKSVGIYGILAHLAIEARNGLATIGGNDPTGLLLAPFADYPGKEFRASGTVDLNRHIAALDAAVAEMDSRIAGMLAAGLDKIQPSPETPALVIVLEEYPGLVAAIKTADAALKPAERRLPRLKANVQRLIQEGAKAAVRVIVVAQRMDAEIIGGSERSNIGNRISLRVDNADAVRMLHPNATPELVEQINSFDSGYAYLERPAEPGEIVRFDYLDYADFRRHVLANTPVEGGDPAELPQPVPPLSR